MTRSSIESLESRTYFTTYLVNTAADSVAADGFLSLREAITAANTNAAFGDAKAGGANDIILFASSLKNSTIALGGSELSITSKLTINARGKNITVDAGSASRVLNINTDQQVTISEMLMKHGSAASGGGVLIDGGARVTLRWLAVFSNTSTGDGAGIAINNGTLSMFHSDVTDNIGSATRGGGIYVSSAASLNMQYANIDGNHAAGSVGGGGIANDGGVVNIFRSAFHQNYAEPAEQGGGFLNISGATTMRQTLFDANAANDGAGMAINDGTVVLRRVRIENSEAGYETAGTGGALLINGANAVVTGFNCDFKNSVMEAGNGGGIAMTAGTLTLTTAYITGNSAGNIAGGMGGGMYIAGGTARLVRSRITGNTLTAPTGVETESGGGIFNNGTLILDHSTVSGNTATTGGGLFTESAGVTTLKHTTISANIPDDQAGTGLVN